ncbi:PAS domain-containing protein [Metabacillus litoralis]|uniref:histidine kinase n=1 Tax=Metabacillus litoralis TaxID=152268 RepID=A0A5C6VX71_9BACI|nr:ATP-binding protein [Metabacillus litoralis]TXC89851.1 PAS domain-containing protein [Metabacillus litoralis]
MTSNVSDDNELEQLKKENDLLRRTLGQIKGTFTYHDQQLGLTVKKDEKQNIEITKMDNHLLSDYGGLKESEGFLPAILDFVPHHIVFVDAKGIITFCNQQAAKDLNVERDQIIGKHIRELLQIPDEQIAVLESIKSGTELKNKEVLDMNYGIINTRILWNPDGSIKRVIGTFYFLNVIKEAEKQALAGRIAAGIAHEIRNPLTTVRGYLQFLSESDDNEHTKLFSNLLIPELDRANKIISDFLSIAKPAHTKTKELNIYEFLTEYLGKFLKSEALLYNAKLHYELHPLTRKLSIKGHQDELLQVFMNLLRNSMQAKNHAPLEITIKTTVRAQHIQIQFIDNGIGIHTSILSHVFDPFFSTKEEGTGLGLSVSRKIIENHGGTMTVESDVNGTQFSISLPIYND